MIFPLWFTFSASEVPVIATLYCLVPWIHIIFLSDFHPFSGVIFLFLSKLRRNIGSTCRVIWRDYQNWQIPSCWSFHLCQILLQSCLSFSPSNAASFPLCETATLLKRIPAERETRQAFHALGALRVPMMSREVVFSTAVPRTLWV